MGLMDRFKKKEELLMPEPAPEIPSEPEPYVERAPEPKEFQENRNQQYTPAYQTPVQMPNQQQNQSYTDTSNKHQFELINSKLDIIKMQLDNLNQAITILNAKLR